MAPPRPAPPASQLRLQALLELKVQRLEAELEKRNQEAQGSFQAMEQRFQALQVELRNLQLQRSRRPGSQRRCALWLGALPAAGV